MVFYSPGEKDHFDDLYSAGTIAVSIIFCLVVTPIIIKQYNSGFFSTLSTRLLSSNIIWFGFLHSIKNLKWFLNMIAAVFSSLTRS